MVQREPLDAAFPSPLPSTLVALQRDLPLRPTASRRCAQGVFSLGHLAGHPCPETVLHNPDVDGVSIRQAWADLEPSEGAFDWSFLDSEVSRAAAAGKQVLLRINTQAQQTRLGYGAVTEAGGTLYQLSEDDGVETTIPVYWDPTFLAKKKAMITALGAHFTSNPAIVIVWTSFANAHSEDWSVPHTSIRDRQAWHAVGYTTDKLLDAGKQIIDTTMAAFPKQYVTLAMRSAPQEPMVVSIPTQTMRRPQCHSRRPRDLARALDRPEK